MKNLLLILFLATLTLSSCLKDPMDPEPIICITEPTFIGKWEQISVIENHLNTDGKKIKVSTTEFKENDEKAIKIEFFDSNIEGVEVNDDDKYIAEGKYISKVYNEETQEIITIEDVYKIIKFYGTYPSLQIELDADNQTTQYFLKIDQSEKGVVLILTNTVVEGEGVDKKVIETILIFKRKF